MQPNILKSKNLKRNFIIKKLYIDNFYLTYWYLLLNINFEGHGAGAPPGLQNQCHGERPVGGLPLEGAMVGSIPTAPLQLMILVHCLNLKFEVDRAL